MTESTDIDTLRIIADANLDRLAAQRSAIERLETKGAILLGFAVTAAQLTLLADDLIIGWRIAAIANYAASFLAGLTVVAPFKHAHPPEPKVFYDRYHTAPPAAALRVLAATRAVAFERNLEAAHRKTRAWWRTLALLTIGVTLSGVATLEGG